jgi:hypothetical protein
MGILKRLNKKNKTEAREEARKRELFLKEFQILSQKWGYDISSEIVFDRGVIMSRPILVKNTDKPVIEKAVEGIKGSSDNTNTDEGAIDNILPDIK